MDVIGRFRVLWRWLPHPHWWRYYSDRLGASRECRVCLRNEFVAR